MTQGTLTFNSTLSKVQNSLKTVPWTFSKDGLLRSGDSLMIKNKKVNGYLAADVGSKQAGVDNAFIINASKQNQGPIARSVFILTKYEAEDAFGSDDIIRFG